MDTVFLNKFGLFIKELLPDSTCSGIDARIIGIIYYQDSYHQDTICLGEYWGIDLNGNFMQDNENLLSLVKENIWRSEPLDSMIRKLPFYKDWDPEILQQYIEMTK